MLSLGLAFFIGATSAARFPSICQSEPLPDLAAGSTVSVRIDAIANAALRCQAVLNFENVNFLPVTALFDAFQLGCPGPMVAEFEIPAEAPVGPAQLTWLCNGHKYSPTCSNAVISEGRGDEWALPAVLSGSVGCLTAVAVPTTKTTTITAGTVTSVKTITETIETVSTKFPSKETSPSTTSTTMLTTTATMPATQTIPTSLEVIPVSD